MQQQQQQQKQQQLALLRKQAQIGLSTLHRNGRLRSSLAECQAAPSEESAQVRLINLCSHARAEISRLNQAGQLQQLVEECQDDKTQLEDFLSLEACLLPKCGKPTWNGKPNEFCSIGCMREAEPQQSDDGLGAKPAVRKLKAQLKVAEEQSRVVREELESEVANLRAQLEKQSPQGWHSSLGDNVVDADAPQLLDEVMRLTARAEKAEKEVSTLEEDLELERTILQTLSMEKTTLLGDLFDAREQARDAEVTAAERFAELEEAHRSVTKQRDDIQIEKDSEGMAHRQEHDEELDRLRLVETYLESQCAELQKYIASLLQAAEDKDSEVEQLQGELEQAAEDRARQTQQARQELEELRVICDQRQRDAEERNRRASMSRRSLAAHGSLGVELDEQLLALQNEVDQLTRDNDRLIQQNEEEQTLQALEHASSVESTAAKHRQEVERLQHRCEKLESENTAHRRDAQDISAASRDRIATETPAGAGRAVQMFQQLGATGWRLHLEQELEKRVIESKELRAEKESLSGNLAEQGEEVQTLKDQLAIAQQQVEVTIQQQHVIESLCAGIESSERAAEDLIRQLQEIPEELLEEARRECIELRAKLAKTSDIEQKEVATMQMEISVLRKENERLKDRDREALELEGLLSNSEKQLAKSEVELHSLRQASERELEALSLKQRAAQLLPSDDIPTSGLFAPSVLVYDCQDYAVGFRRIIRIQVPGRHLDDEGKPAITGTIQPLVGGVLVRLSKEAELPDKANVISPPQFVDIAGSWEWKYEPTDGLWEVSKCWGLAHGVLGVALSRVLDGKVYPVGQPSPLPAKTSRKKVVKSRPQKPVSCSDNFAVVIVSAEGSSPIVQTQLLRDMALISENGAVVQVADLIVGMRIRGPYEFVEVRKIQWIPKQQHRVLTLYTGLESVSVLADQQIVAGTYTEDGAASSDWNQQLACGLCAGEHELALHSADGLEEGAAITAVRRFIRCTAVAEIELWGGGAIFVGLQPVLPRTTVPGGRQTLAQQISQKSFTSQKSVGGAWH